MSRFGSVIFLALAMVSCNGSVRQTAFDKKLWMVRDGHYYLREGMVHDLIENHLQRGMPYDKVIELLGEGSHRPDNFERRYEIAVDYVFHDIDPVGGIYLNIKFAADSLVSDIVLNYWGRREGTID